MADQRQADTTSTWRPVGMADMTAEEQLRQLTCFSECLHGLTLLRPSEQTAVRLEAAISRARRITNVQATIGKNGSGDGTAASAHSVAELAEEAEAAMTAVMDDIGEQVESKDWDDLAAADLAIDEFQALMDALPPRLAETTLPPAVFLGEEARRQFFDQHVRARLGISGQEFLRRLDAGEYGPETHLTDVGFLAAMQSFGR